MLYAASLRCPHRKLRAPIRHTHRTIFTLEAGSRHLTVKFRLIRARGGYFEHSAANPRRWGVQDSRRTISRFGRVEYRGSLPHKNASRTSITRGEGFASTVPSGSSERWFAHTTLNKDVHSNQAISKQPGDRFGNTALHSNFNRNSSSTESRESVDFTRILQNSLNILHRDFTQQSSSTFLGIHKRKLMQYLFAYKSQILRESTQFPQSEFVLDLKDHFWKQLRSVRKLPSGLSIVDVKLKMRFLNMLNKEAKELHSLKQLKEIADSKYPDMWYSRARQMSRKFHLHVGPTNSGKTYQALKHLESASNGAYAGPLRLLAREVHSKFEKLGKPCNLVTGDDRKIEHDFRDAISCCTVEMIPLFTEMDVAVIDEIQMMGDPERGFSWTAACLGVMAKTIHLCGEPRSVPLIKQICEYLGEDLEIHTYERLNPLEVTNTHISTNLQKLEKGDCLICFDRSTVNSMKQEIEKSTGKKCALVYGSLPPLVRSRQADLFNDPSNDYDFLVATDAIGLGLNLRIRRMIFTTVRKSHGTTETEPVVSTHIKQIAGRAGRYGLYESPSTKPQAENAAPDMDPQSSRVQDLTPKRQEPGLVSAFNAADLRYIRHSMGQEAGPIKAARVQAPASVMSHFAAQFPPEIPFSYVYLQFYSLADFGTSGVFRPSESLEHVQVLHALDRIRDLSVEERMHFALAPAGASSKSLTLLLALARIVAGYNKGDLLDLVEINFELLDQPPKKGIEYQRKLEDLHKQLDLYIWLSYRFPSILRSRPVAEKAREMVEIEINSCIERRGSGESKAVEASDHTSALTNEDELNVNAEGAPHVPGGRTRPKGEPAGWRALQRATNSGMVDHAPDLGGTGSNLDIFSLSRSTG